MTFIWPVMLLGILALPLGLLASRVVERRRGRRAAALGARLVGGPGPNAGRRRRLPGALLFAGLAISTLALARPQSVVSLPRLEGTVILAFDVSGSMAATDFAPTRMEAAKAAARGFVQRQPSSVIVGVVAFSDSGFSVQLPTSDQAAVLAAIGRLAPQRGTSLANGITTALKAIEDAADTRPKNFYTNRTPEPTARPTPRPAGTFSSASIVLLSDGENTVDPDPIPAAQAAADRGVRIHTIGIGSPEGVTLDVEGFRVHTALDEAELRLIADTTHGSYFPAASEGDLARIYDSIDPELVVAPQEIEVTSLFVAAAVAFLIAGVALSLTWSGRLP
jgi:Ca-activated chloride channel family protein